MTQPTVADTLGQYLPAATTLRNAEMPNIYSMSKDNYPQGRGLISHNNVKPDDTSGSGIVFIYYIGERSLLEGCG